MLGSLFSSKIFSIKHAPLPPKHTPSWFNLPETNFGASCKFELCEKKKKKDMLSQ